MIRCSRKALSTTETELSAIDAPATQGASSPIAPNLTFNSM
ncbi:hypothetical protein [Paenibacillus sp. GbtcB18]|nr:hypothetical protein [Paenibacillus sp. GbtcB18]